MSLKPGDEVICSNLDAPCPHGMEGGVIPCFCGSCLNDPTVGERYVVAEVSTGGGFFCRCEVPLMQAVGHRHPQQAWPQSWFRLQKFEEDPAPSISTEKPLETV